MLKMQKRKYFIIMPRCSINALTFYRTKCYGFILLNSCGEKKAVVSVLVGDDDSSTISKVRQNVEHDVEKWSDVVHAKRSFGSSLYSIKTQNKSLTDTVIRYFQRCFGYALKQNKDDEEGVRNSLRSIVPHAYGDHSSCGNWCGYLKNPASYKHWGLPHGKDLTDKSLRQSLEKIIEVSTVYMMYGGTACSSQIPNSHHFSRGTHLQKNSVSAYDCILKNNCKGKRRALKDFQPLS